jgi:hypothetical protein
LRGISEVKEGVSEPLENIGRYFETLGVPVNGKAKRGAQLFLG